MADKLKVYIETCSVIDVAKYLNPQSAPDDKQADIKFTQQIMKAAKDGEILLYTSTITIAECQHVGDPKPSEEVKRLFKSILTSGQVFQLISDSVFIAERARDLRWDHEITLGGCDAIHVASALEQECGEFITIDEKGPLKNADKIAKLGMKVIRASQTSLLPAKYLKELGQPNLFDGEAQANAGEPSDELHEE